MAMRVESVLVVDQALAPSTTLDPINLPVNPLSFLRLTVRALNNTAVITNYRMIAAFMNFISNVEVRFKGHVIIGGSLEDLAILNALLTGFIPVQNNISEVDNEVRTATFIISFSRRPYWREEAFPAVRSGELTLHISSGAAVTGLDGFTIHVETVELLSVTPARFLKYTAQARTFASTGQNDIDLPIGNPILGIQVFATSVPTGVTRNATAREMRILVDNVETDYALVEWESLHGELGRRLKDYLAWQAHIHSVNAAGVAREDTEQPKFDSETVENYAYLDFDPLMDGSYALPTAGRSRVQLRVNADVADLIRISPVELFEIAQLPGLRAGAPGGR